MSGIALYNIGDTCFQRLLQRVEYLYPGIAFENALDGFMRERSKFIEHQRLMHKFVYTNLFQIFEQGDYSKREILSNSMETVLIVPL